MRAPANTPGNSGFGRTIILAIIFVGGMYAIGATLIGMV